MTNEEKIARFIGWTKCECGNKEPHYKYGERHWESVDVKDMKFGKSYDAIMPALEKINKLHLEKFSYKAEDIKKGLWPQDVEYMNVLGIPIYTPIAEVAEKVAKFIDWYEDFNRNNEAITKAWMEIGRTQQEDHEANIALLKANNIPAEDVDRLVDGFRINGRMEIVSAPSGEDQNESSGRFLNVFVDQWQTGTEGDSFCGFVYGEIQNGRWLKVPYED